MLLLFENELRDSSPESLERLRLTQREAERLAWVSMGKTNLGIAKILGLSVRTVEKHVERILEKLGVDTRTAAARCRYELLKRASNPSARSSQ